MKGRQVEVRFKRFELEKVHEFNTRGQRFRATGSVVSVVSVSGTCEYRQDRVNGDKCQE